MACGCTGGGTSTSNSIGHDMYTRAEPVIMETEGHRKERGGRKEGESFNRVTVKEFLLVGTLGPKGLRKNATAYRYGNPELTRKRKNSTGYLNICE